MYTDDGPFQNCHNQLLTPQQASKRVCRNLTAEFCPGSSETSSSSEPNLDLWVLRTLGLKDRDTIDTSNDVAVTSSSESTLDSSFSPSVASSSVHNYCRRPTHQTDYRYSSADCQEANCGNPAKSSQNCPSQCFNFTATGLTRPREAPEAVIRSYNTLHTHTTAFQTPPLTEEPAFSQSSHRAEICSSTVSSRVQTLEGHQANHPAYWSPLRGAPSQDKIHLSPAGERVPFSPISSSSPVMNQQWISVCGGSPVSPSAGSGTPATPQTPCSRRDLAFSMSLSPSSSVKTHSFPQGQAFIRKDPEGRWNFTWVPRQGP